MIKHKRLERERITIQRMIVFILKRNIRLHSENYARITRHCFIKPFSRSTAVLSNGVNQPVLGALPLLPGKNARKD